MKRLTKLGLLAGAAALTAGAAHAGDDAMKHDMDYSQARAMDGSVETSLGVKVSQIDDADIITADGESVGEVEAVLNGADGAPQSVLVELERDFDDQDRYVEMRLSELTAQEDDDFINLWDDRIDLVTQKTAADIQAMERWSYEPELSEMDEARVEGHGQTGVKLTEADKDRLRDEIATDRELDTSLGVKVGQIDDADVIAADGEEIGEVEAVLKDAAGEPARLLVELDSGLFERDRLVEIDINQFSTVPDDDFLNLWDDAYDLVINQPVEYFDSMPDWQYTVEMSDRASLE